MRFADSPSRSSVWVCGAILALTLAGKAFALMHRGGLLAQSHPFLPGAYEPYVWLGLAAELVAFGVLAVVGRRGFLTVCLGLSVVFIGYHALEAGLDVPAPCPCLGGLLSHWKPLAGADSALSFVLACGLAIASFVGLFPVSPRASPEPLPHPPTAGGALAIGLWLMAGAAVLWLWEGQILGADEGMEGAKALQLLVRPESLPRIWNDQPPLWSIVGAGIFHVFGPSMAVGRIAVVLIGLAMPLTWVLYWSREGVKWAAVLSTVLLWLTVPSVIGSFMLEAPAYAVGTAALVPLLLGRGRRVPLLGSAVIAALALSLKLTAAFALVVPFTWLLQRNSRRALMWGVSVVALTVVGSLIQPGWSWRMMASSHLNFKAAEIWRYHLDPAVYARGWLICLLALFALAYRYLANRLAPIIPWLSAGLVALVVHLFHRPFWSYYNLHLMVPVAVLAGVGMVDLWAVLRNSQLPRLERGCLTGGVAVLGLLWTWQQGQQIAASRTGATVVATSPITAQLRSLGAAGHTMFSMNPTWTFAAHQPQTPPELTVIPLKRAWSGQINDAMVAGLLASNRVDAVVLNQNVLTQPVWSNLLAVYVPTARENESILFVRRDLNPKPIALNLNNETALELRQLGLGTGSNHPSTNLLLQQSILTHVR